MISVVVNTLLGGPYLGRILRALLAQQGAPALEIIVPWCPSIDDVTAQRSAFPSVRFVAVDGLPPEATLSDPELAHLIYDRRRAVGLAAAHGDIVVLTEDQMLPDPGWCAAILEAHREPFAAIGGAVVNAGPGVLHRALWLCDFGRYQPPFAAAEAASLTDQNVSYKRAALETTRREWSRFYHEPALHEALRAAGETLWLTPACVVRMDRGRLTWARQLRERFAWGRVFGRQRARRIPAARRALLILLSPLIPALIVWRCAATALRRGHSPLSLAAALPAVAILALAWACGETAGYLGSTRLSNPSPDAPAPALL